jgi:hypothetical protein
LLWIGRCLPCKALTAQVKNEALYMIIKPKLLTGWNDRGKQ